MATLAVFVTPHGFGHAARACAVVEALGERVRGLRCELFTTVPEWFFAESLSVPHRVHRVACDVGLVQRSSLHEDPEATVRALAATLPVSDARLDELTAELDRAGVSAVLCDVSPVGAAVAERARLPVVLIENFTWDWVYAAYQEQCPGLVPFAEWIRAVNERVTRRVQTEPVCAAVAGALQVPPISRRPRGSRRAVRSRLGVPVDAPLVLLTMGGIPFDFGALDRLAGHPGAHFVVPGAGAGGRRRGRLLELPHHSGFFHPDLVGASDLVVGKAGYSTVAEVAHGTAALACVPRPRFPESAVLMEWASRELGAIALSEDELLAWEWVGRLDELLASRRATVLGHGAAAAAEAVRELM